MAEKLVFFDHKLFISGSNDKKP